MTLAKVLVVDDDPGMRRVLRLALEEVGIEVHEASDGSSALNGIEELAPDLAILDINMPGLNGWELARHLRGNPETASIKLLMLSGVGSEVLGATVGVLGGDLALDKPFDVVDLREAVRLLLEQRKAEERGSTGAG